MSYILFGSKSTKNDYGFMVAPYAIPMPAVQTNYVAIPGRDGSLDLTEGFGRIRYSDRVISLTLYALAPHDTAVSEFVNDVHGKRMQLVFDKDADFYYIGRVSVDGLLKQDGYCVVTVTVFAEPYKYKRNITTVSITGDGVVSLNNLKMAVVPQITATAPATLSYTSGSATTYWSITAGTHVVPALILETSSNTLGVTTTGTVTFQYREGAL